MCMIQTWWLTVKVMTTLMCMVQIWWLIKKFIAQINIHGSKYDDSLKKKW
jgi:hypothetical protein